MARKFLYVIAALVALALAALVAYRIWGNELMRLAFVPGSAFERQAEVDARRYDDPAMWFSRPGTPGDPARWVPAGYAPGEEGRGAAIFFIHPTSYVNRSRWNAPLDEDEANQRARVFLRGQASAFNAAGDIWAPRYRQATFGAFLTTAPEAQAAFDLAYRDVAAAFTAFLRQVGDKRPIILAGHSQGALHLERLLRERVAGTKIARRVVAAYVIGWPISVATDLPLLGLPACTAPAQRGCILSWESFAEPADTRLILDTYDATRGFNGQPRRGTAILCVNPITGTRDGTASASANLGTLFPAADLATATIAPGRVGAACSGRGFLSIGEAVDVGPYVLPGNNYHVYDYSLFWANVRADAARRMAGR